MTRKERRARKGGNKVFHDDPNGSDRKRASADGWLLGKKRWKSQ